MPVLRLSLLFAALLACLASVLNPDSDIPQTDSCDSASQASVDALAILWGPSAGTESELQDYQEVTTVLGSQGGSMLRLQFRLEASSAPACAAFAFQLEQCLDLMCETTLEADTHVEAHSLRVYADGDAHITKDFYLILPYRFELAGTLARLQVRVGQAEAQSLVWIEHASSFADAGPRDAGRTDAGLAIDAGP